MVVFLVIVGALVWQEARRQPGAAEAAYVVDDVIAFVVERLDPQVRHRVRTDGVRRIIEWEVFYLQGLAQEDRRRPVETVAGGWPESVAYIVARIADVHGAIYDPHDVAEVLSLEAEYLAVIGAVGEPVDLDEKEVDPQMRVDPEMGVDPMKSDGGDEA